MKFKMEKMSIHSINRFAEQEKHVDHFRDVMKSKIDKEIKHVK